MWPGSCFCHLAPRLSVRGTDSLFSRQCQRGKRDCVQVDAAANFRYISGSQLKLGSGTARSPTQLKKSSGTSDESRQGASESEMRQNHGDRHAIPSFKSILALSRDGPSVCEDPGILTAESSDPMLLSRSHVVPATSLTLEDSSLIPSSYSSMGEGPGLKDVSLSPILPYQQASLCPVISWSDSSQLAD